MKPYSGMLLLALSIPVSGRGQYVPPEHPQPPQAPGVRVQIHERASKKARAMKDSLIRIDIQLGALDSLLKNLPLPEQIEFDDHVLRIRNDSLLGRHTRPPKPETERRDVVKFGEDVIVGRNEVVVGDVVVVDGDATIYGRVEGGVVVVKGNIRLASTARVKNDIVCVWGNTEVDPGARAGSTKVFNFGKTYGKWFGPRPDKIPSILLIARLLRTVFLLAAALLIAAAFTEPMRRVRRTIEKSYAKCLAAGLITLFLLPFAFFVLVITILGIPIAVLLLPLAVLGAFLMGITAFGFLAGEWLLDRFHADRPSIVLSTVVGILLFELPSLLSKPFALFGSLFTVFILIVNIVLFLMVWTPAFGAVVLSRYGRAPKTAAK
jgi:hypothetical protein